MKRNKKTIFLLLILLLVVLIIISFNPLRKSFSKPTPSATQLGQNKTFIDACKTSGGTWIEEYNECEGASNMLSNTECVKLGGKYFECESPCRHNPEADACITLCMKVCKF